MGRFARGYEALARTIMMIAVVHVAMIAYTLAGLVVAGLFPSVAAAYGTFRRWLRSPDDRGWTVRQSWTTFRKAWRSELVSANLLGWPLTALWALLLWEYWIVQRNDFGVAGVAVSGVLLMVNVFYLVFQGLVWICHVHFAEATAWVLRRAAMLAVGRPLCSLMILATAVTVAWLYWKWPGLGAAFGLALPIFAVIAIAYCWARLPGLNPHGSNPAPDGDS
ncbi:YesL family protein [Bifidobacterium choloepi]|uniref:DUF624 domain-containing protein n=1 Tax=Bifidobacterium choloepi TaxID=2614131 RepID=A0A6I5NIS2_9BIFI|nr:DUF624 domain-containing protein [Bifidobacterium choloepi]NEG70283.1 DUF624 domain-containing protein [Bifidobacterium choloepi]